MLVLIVLMLHFLPPLKSRLFLVHAARSLNFCLLKDLTTMRLKTSEELLTGGTNFVKPGFRCLKEEYNGLRQALSDFRARRYLDQW